MGRTAKPWEVTNARQDSWSNEGTKAVELVYSCSTATMDIEQGAEKTKERSLERMR